MKLFYVVDKDLAAKVTFGHYALDLGADKVLMAIEWREDISEMQWANTPGVTPLPHPVFEAATPLTDEHLAHLSRRYPVKSGDTIHHLIQHAIKEEPCMRIWVL